MKSTQLSIGLLSLALTATVFASVQPHKHTTGGTKEALTIFKDTAKSYIDEQIGHWLSRTDIAYDIQESLKPVASIETIQPIFMDKLHTIFWQGRAAYANTSTTLNLGVGYRYLTLDKDWLLGINAFYDNNIRFHHSRLGLGGEVFTPYVTIRANYYDALSGRKKVSSTTYEQALDGADLSAETPMPYLPWMRFTAQGYYWRGDNNTDVGGGLVQARTFPLNFLEVDAGIAYDNDQHRQFFLLANLYLGHPAFIENSATSQLVGNTTVAKQDLENMRLQKVIRENDIAVENSRNAVGINIARGT